MDKLKMHSADKVQENYEKLAALFPEAVTETITGYDDSGKAIVERAVDADVLRQLISSRVVEGREERYQFTWPDKKKAILESNAPITATLRPVREKSASFDKTENLYIEGNNLDVLKLLQETYLGKIKMIYIDPPYNTGKDFVYSDNYSQEINDYVANSGQYDEQGNRMVQNTESNGRFHTDWLNKLYPQLRLAKNLLTDDGVILLSIGDKEVRNSLFMLDEIYGASNQVCTFVWKSRAKPTNAGNARFRPQKISEYVLVYSKENPDDQLYNVIPAKERVYPHKDEKGEFRITTILTSNRGTFRRETMRFESHGYIPDEDYRWKAGKEVIDRLYDTGHMFTNDDGIPMEKKYRTEETDPLYPIYTYLDKDLSGTAEKGKADLSDLVGKRHGFDTVKPVQLIKYLIQTFTNKDDIVLDFFSGSGTTAQACIEQNSEDDGTRKFILVQIGEKCDPEGEAYQSGFHTICDIAMGRINAFTIKYHPQADAGYRYLKLSSSNMKDVYYSPNETDVSMFDILADNIKDDRTPEDLLFQVMLDLGVLLSSKIEETTIAGKCIFSVADGFLIACFDSDVTDETVTAIAQQKPYYAVFRDSGMTNDSVATNFDQIFAAYSPSTVRKVL